MLHLMFPWIFYDRETKLGGPDCWGKDIATTHKHKLLE